MSAVQASTSCVSFALFEGHSPSRHRSSSYMPSSTADWITATVCLPGWVTSWSVNFNQFYERQHGWFSRRSTTTSPMTFETNYTGFRFGSEFCLNFVYSFSAAFVVKLLHTSRRCFLSFQAVMRCGLIARRLVVISLFHGHSPRPSALVGLRSLGWPHRTHSQHIWKIKICLPLSSDLNSKLTFLAPKSLICFFSTLLIRLYMFWPGTFLLASYVALSQWILICKGALKMIYRIVECCFLYLSNLTWPWSEQFHSSSTSTYAELMLVYLPDHTSVISVLKTILVSISVLTFSISIHT